MCSCSRCIASTAQRVAGRGCGLVSGCAAAAAAAAAALRAPPLLPHPTHAALPCAPFCSATGEPAGKEREALQGCPGLRRGHRRAAGAHLGRGCGRAAQLVAVCRAACAPLPRWQRPQAPRPARLLRPPLTFSSHTISLPQSSNPSFPAGDCGVFEEPRQVHAAGRQAAQGSAAHRPTRCAATRGGRAWGSPPCRCGVPAWLVCRSCGSGLGRLATCGSCR